MRLILSFSALFCVAGTFVAVDSFSTTSPSSVWKSQLARDVSMHAENNPFFATSKDLKEDQQSQKKQKRRALGSQELLMLPRQYGVNPNVKFPSMNHISCAILSNTPTESVLKQAIDEVMRAHPLLQSKVEGDGEPDKRIDLFQMVRKGEPNPPTFLTVPGTFSANDIVKIVNVDGSDRAALDASWQQAFGSDLDDGSWCQVEKSSPLWKVELHKLKSSNSNKDAPCALLFSFNHAISDQSSASRLTDQIVSLMAELEEKGNIQNKPAKQEIPISLEESVLGRQQTWRDVQARGLSFGTLKYIAGKAGEDARGPVIMPDGFSQGGGIVGALTTLSGKAAGGEDEKSAERTSTLQFRTLSEEVCSALLLKCRENGVTITNALSASATLTATDFVDSGKQVGKDRTYKVLQSLDMRRFGEQLDKGESVGCLAGSMDLMHGPLPDRSGEQLRTNPTSKGMDGFWSLAKEGQQQIAEFIKSDGPKHAVRVFDFAMTIADLNNLVHLTAQSKQSQGRAYSAGFTNAGVYERLEAFRKEGDATERQPIQVCVTSQCLVYHFTDAYDLSSCM
jgi:hypothetical protein